MHVDRFQAWHKQQRRTSLLLTAIVWDDMQVKINAYSGPGCDVVRIPGFGNGVGLSPGAIVGA